MNLNLLKIFGLSTNDIYHIYGDTFNRSFPAYVGNTDEEFDFAAADIVKIVVDLRDYKTQKKVLTFSSDEDTLSFGLGYINLFQQIIKLPFGKYYFNIAMIDSNDEKYTKIGGDFYILPKNIGGTENKAAQNINLVAIKLNKFDVNLEAYKDDGDPFDPTLDNIVGGVCNIYKKNDAKTNPTIVKQFATADNSMEITTGNIRLVHDSVEMDFDPAFYAYQIIFYQYSTDTRNYTILVGDFIMSSDTTEAATYSYKFSGQIL